MSASIECSMMGQKMASKSQCCRRDGAIISDVLRAVGRELVKPNAIEMPAYAATKHPSLPRQEYSRTDLPEPPEDVVTKDWEAPNQ